MLFRKLFLLIAVSLLAVVPCGCFSNTAAPVPETEDSLPYATTSPSVTVVVSTDFGAEILLEETVVISGDTSALDALEEVADVETEYGGGFVNAINGISSQYEGANRNKMDWFFCINGFSSKIGVKDYILQAGDTQHWDFHDWGFRQFIPGMPGYFPEPFLHGYGGEIRPAIVCYQDGWEESARLIADRLSQSGVDGVSTRSASTLPAGEKTSSNLILLGTADLPLIDEMNRIWNKLGFFCCFEDGGLKVFNGAGALAEEYMGGVGVILATQNPWNTNGTGVCQNVTWVVSGLDEAGVEKAVDTLVNKSDSFKHAFGVVVVDKIIRVPR